MSPASGRGTRGRLVLRLYVAGDSPNSMLAKANLQKAIAHLARADVTVETVDVLLDPDRGLREGILVTPTLVRVAPAPERRVIGTLHDRTALVAGLGIVDFPHE
jgi:circadian clock protein KaiB